MVFLKALEMSRTKIMRPSADEIDMMMQRGCMPATGTYDIVYSTPSTVDDPSAHILEYKPY